MSAPVSYSLFIRPSVQPRASLGPQPATLPSMKKTWTATKTAGSLAPYGFGRMDG
jgi:hypothetical protein